MSGQHPYTLEWSRTAGVHGLYLRVKDPIRIDLHQSIRLLFGLQRARGGRRLLVIVCGDSAPLIRAREQRVESFAGRRVGLADQIDADEQRLQFDAHRTQQR